MIEKETYNADEFAAILRIKLWKVLDMIKKGEVKHIHVNETHHNVRIPAEEVNRIMKSRS